MYSAHNEELSVVAERFIRTLKNKIYKYMYIDKSDDIVNKYHKTTKMKPVYVMPSIYINFNKENNKKSPKFKVRDYVRISKYKNISTKMLCSKLV